MMKRIPRFLIWGGSTLLGAMTVRAEPLPVYNPDPGASMRAEDTPFYEPPPGTPADYGQERDPLLDAPPSNISDLDYIKKVWKNQDYSRKFPRLPYTKGLADRWRINIPAWMRYNNPDIETPYMYNTPRLWDPYKQSVLKGDVPVIGQDYFLSMAATSFTAYEVRDIPTPSNVSSASGNSSEFYGSGRQQSVNQFFLLNFDFFKGETNFKPVTWLVHVQPVYNINYTQVNETGILQPNTQGGNVPGTSPLAAGNGVIVNPGDAAAYLYGGTSGLQRVGSRRLGPVYLDRTREYLSLQEASVEVHLADLSSNYDFVSMSVGNQPFNSDFRGFVFNDTNSGARIFGNAGSNRWQYNVAAFDMREKDTNSGLNTFDSRDQQVYVANVYRQDFIVKGYTAQLSFLANQDTGGDFHYNRNGFLVRPEPIGTVAPHRLRSYYLGWNGDGHIGRFNVSHSFYQVLGRDELNGLAGKTVNINSQMGAAEISYDFDWLRFKGTFFYASGDSNPTDSEATGFDSIVDRPNFAGGANSYYARQGFNLGGSSVAFKGRDSLLTNLRSDKFEGQSNFVNPGVFIYGVGVDADVLPTLKLSLNANYIRFADVATIDTTLQTNKTEEEIGWDLNIGAVYRPLLTDNVIISSGFGTLLPGPGYRSIYRTAAPTVPGYPNNSPGDFVESFLYSGFVAVTLTY